MNPIDIAEVKEFVKNNIKCFHENRLQCLESTEFRDLIQKKNPYLFRAKNLLTAQEVVISFLDAKLSSAEEKIFGDFLELLAIFVAQKTLNAGKSSSHGIDFEYSDGNTRYLVTVKSGLNWGNSSQWKALENDFKMALKVLSQSRSVGNVKCILGISYGKQTTAVRRGIIQQVCGQEFWYVISGKKEFYIEIVEPLGYKAKELNDEFNKKKAEIINKFTKDFLNEFCDNNGKILWNKLVKYNSGNM